jgi:hypothetical protein
MTPQDEKLLAAIKAAYDGPLQRELIQAKRKLKRALEQRDVWAAKARHYRDKLLERT